MKIPNYSEINAIVLRTKVPDEDSKELMKAGILSPRVIAEDTSNCRIRWFVLIVLCFQNSGHALLTRYSQGVLHEKYSSTEVVLVGEIIKIIVSAYLILAENEDSDATGNGFTKLLWLAVNARKVIVLVILYSIGNILAYYALARVDAAAYTVCLQLKAFTTAGFAVIVLGRNISFPKWRALMLLVVGCILVASPTFNRPCAEQLLASQNKTDSTVSVFESALGLGAVLIMVTISGFSATYFESMLKKTNEKITIWERNFQLALYSILFLISLVVYESMSNATTNEWKPFFSGWTINTVLITAIQAGGGLLVAATLKYADAVLKTLATAGSIVLSAVLGHMLLGGTLDIFVVLGSFSTILAIFNYTLDTSI
eukprot:gene7860-16084_t